MANTVRAAIIGTGWGAVTLAPALATTPEVDLVAVCSARMSRAKSTAERFQVRYAFDNYKELVAMNDLDVIFVCTPPGFHVEMTTAVIESGRHVFCTKPLAPSAEEGRKLCDSARSRDLVNVMDFGWRYAPENLYLRDLVRSGYLGNLRFVSATVFVAGGQYFSWLSQRPHGGMLHASPLPHHLDRIRFTFGELYDVGGTATTLVREKPVLSEIYESRYGVDVGAEIKGTAAADAEDAVAIHARFENGALMSLASSSSVNHGTGERLEAYGSKGAIVLERTGGYESSGRLFGATGLDAKLAELPIPERYQLPGISGTEQGRPAMYARLAKEVAGVILGRQGEGLFATFEDGVRLLEISEAVIT